MFSMLYLKTRHLEPFLQIEKKKGIIRDENNLDTDPSMWNFKDEWKGFSYTGKWGSLSLNRRKDYYSEM